MQNKNIDYEEHELILEHLHKIIEKNFVKEIKIITAMLEQLDNEQEREFADSPINVLENAIKYRYITLVELYKKISQAISYFYFEGNYQSMNATILRKETKLYEQNLKILENRNKLAHTLSGDISLELERHKIIKKIEKRMKFIQETLIKYLEYNERNYERRKKYKKLNNF